MNFQQNQAWVTSLRLLAATPKTRKELANKLAGKGFSESVVEETLDKMEAQGLLSDLAYAKNLPPGDQLDQLTQDFFVQEEALRKALENKGVTTDQFVKCQNVTTASQRYACVNELSEYAKATFLDNRDGVYLMVRFDTIVPSGENRLSQAKERSEFYKQALENKIAQGGHADAAIDELIAQANADPIIQNLNYGNQGGDGARRLTGYTRNASDTFADPAFNTLVFNTRPTTISTTQTLRYTKSGSEYGFVWVYISSAQNADPTTYDYNRWLTNTKQSVTVEKHTVGRE